MTAFFETRDPLDDWFLIADVALVLAVVYAVVAATFTELPSMILFFPLSMIPETALAKSMLLAATVFCEP